VSNVRNAFGFAGVALLPICCLGLPLLIAAGISAAALALIAGITVAAIACAVAVALLIARRPEAKAPWRRPSSSVRGGAHGKAE